MHADTITRIALSYGRSARERGASHPNLEIRA